MSVPRGPRQGWVARLRGRIVARAALSSRDGERAPIGGALGIAPSVAVNAQNLSVNLSSKRSSTSASCYAFVTSLGTFGRLLSGLLIVNRIACIE